MLQETQKAMYIPLRLLFAERGWNERVFVTERMVGVSVPRKEGPNKVAGRATYIDDPSLPGMIYASQSRKIFWRSLCAASSRMSAMRGLR